MLESIKHIGEALKAARLKEGLSQRALSAKTKIPQNHISKIENGEVDLQASTLVELSRALNLELMFVPRTLIPTFHALLRGKGSQKQVPKYQLEKDENEENEDDDWL